MQLEFQFVVEYVPFDSTNDPFLSLRFSSVERDGMANLSPLALRVIALRSTTYRIPP
jgi:hypothetical protein